MKQRPKFELNSESVHLALFKEAQRLAAIEQEKQQQTLAPINPDNKPTITIGHFEMTVFYRAPYPEDYHLPKLYICEFCLKHMRTPVIHDRHASKCVWKHPPGNEIYRKGNLSVFEIDGAISKTYCQNLCLIGMSFISNKTQYEEVESFYFYVMTEADNEGCHMVGYFSKEKKSFLNYNLSCILTLPAYQRRGYGRLLIDLSYLLSRIEGKIGSPEQPLSDLGLVSYRSYWKSVLFDHLLQLDGKEFSMKELSQESGIHATDLVNTLQYLEMMKYWKDKHIVLKRRDLLEEYEKSRAKRPKNYKTLDDGCLHWRPYSNKT